VNLGLKEMWGRPRPKQLEQFGGTKQYRAVWQPRFEKIEGDHERSFPSGHTAVGFFYLSLFLVGRRYQNRLLTNGGALLTLFWGPGLMVTRIVQGAHFLSDVVTSVLIMWCVALAVDYVLFEARSTLVKTKV
ncbi:MAG: phosphatase PAP2 family protein, partial [Chlamydiae bacterium]|nr:phosphatase PAP2 family protein [Chlamydiota bacterium]